MPATVASAIRLNGVRLDGRLRSFERFAIVTQHYGSSCRNVECLARRWSEMPDVQIWSRSSSSWPGGSRIRGDGCQFVAAQEHMPLAPVWPRRRAPWECCRRATSFRVAAATPHSLGADASVWCRWRFCCDPASVAGLDNSLAAEHKFLVRKRLTNIWGPVPNGREHRTTPAPWGEP